MSELAVQVEAACNNQRVGDEALFTIDDAGRGRLPGGPAAHSASPDRVPRQPL